jgi:hypothetical protein
MIQLPEGYFWDPEFKLGDESEAIAAKVWPRYLAEQSDLADSDVKLEIPYSEFLKRFPAWGVRSSSDKRLIAYANAVFLKADLSQNYLPDGGWHEVIKAGARLEIPNCLSLVVANVDPEFQSLKISYKLIERAKDAALQYKIKTLIAPVRPSQKHNFPHISMSDYIQLRRSDGKLQDAWLRAHENSGGQMLNICYKSAQVKASIKRWTEWTGQPFIRSGSYKLEKGIAPLLVDVDANTGLYVEPNVWFKYNL